MTGFDQAAFAMIGTAALAVLMLIPYLKYARSRLDKQLSQKSAAQVTNQSSAEEQASPKDSHSGVPNVPWWKQHKPESGSKRNLDLATPALVTSKSRRKRREDIREHLRQVEKAMRRQSVVDKKLQEVTYAALFESVSDDRFPQVVDVEYPAAGEVSRYQPISPLKLLWVPFGTTIGPLHHSTGRPTTSSKKVVRPKKVVTHKPRRIREH